MQRPIITLLTDFGISDSYVASDGSWSCPIESIDHYGNVQLNIPDSVNGLRP